MKQDEIEVLLDHPADGKGDRSIAGIKMAVEGVAVGLLQIVDDQPAVGDGAAIVGDVGKLAFGGLPRVADIDGRIGEPGEAEVGLDLHTERAGVRQAPQGRELVQRNHGASVVAVLRILGTEPPSAPFRNRFCGPARS